MLSLQKLVRLSQRLHEAWRKGSQQRDNFESHWSTASRVWTDLLAVKRQLQLAQGRGFSHCLASLHEDFRWTLDELSRAIQTLRDLRGPPDREPSLGDWVRELRALEEEFGEVVIDEKHSILRVTTEPITLQGVHLGTFGIDLVWARLADTRSSLCFDLVALEPNPPVGRDEVTHPHVNDGELCAGEAAAPIEQALNDGRIGDAFLMIRSVLTTYNARSAYVQLAEWDGLTCGDCGRRVDREESSFCPGCDNDLCENCSSSCRSCEETRCGGCLTACDGCQDLCCSACLRSHRFRTLPVLLVPWRSAVNVRQSCCNPTSMLTASAQPVPSRPKPHPPPYRRKLMPRDPDCPRLIFTPQAWLKWQFLCHAGPTEIGAFGLSSRNDPLRVEDLLVVKQSTTAVSVAFDDAAVADLFDVMADAGIPPNRFARLWLHTHPGASVDPSGVDEETFRRVFGSCDWAVMGILGRTGRNYARLRFNTGPGGALEIPTSVDWASWPEFAISYDLQESIDVWEEEFSRLIAPAVFPLGCGQTWQQIRHSRRPGARSVASRRRQSLPHEYPLWFRMSTILSDRDVRQRDLVPPARLAGVHAIVIGVGSVGRQVALQLAAVGVPKMTLYDPDLVSVENLAPQGFWETDLGTFKVDAAANVCHSQFEMMELHSISERFRKSHVRQWPGGKENAVFACVDAIETRRLIWEAVRPRAAFFADGRMSAEVIRVLASGQPSTDGTYASTLFGAGEAYAGSCTVQVDDLRRQHRRRADAGPVRPLAPRPTRRARPNAQSARRGTHRRRITRHLYPAPRPRGTPVSLGWWCALRGFMLTPGNKKLGTDLIWGFGLPSGRADVCVGMTPICRTSVLRRRTEQYRRQSRRASTNATCTSRKRGTSCAGCGPS